MMRAQEAIERLRAIQIRERHEPGFEVGVKLARRVFERRGNHSEVHLSEAELGALIILGIREFREGRSLKARWQVKIAGGQWMTGIHTFRTKRAAVDFIARWRKAEDRADAAAALLRNGKEVSID